jgi:hypothetical protein
MSIPSAARPAIALQGKATAKLAGAVDAAKKEIIKSAMQTDIG